MQLLIRLLLLGSALCCVSFKLSLRSECYRMTTLQEVSPEKLEAKDGCRRDARVSAASFGEVNL